MPVAESAYRPTIERHSDNHGTSMSPSSDRMGMSGTLLVVGRKTTSRAR